MGTAIDAYIAEWHDDDPGGEHVGLYNVWGDVVQPEFVVPLLADEVENRAALVDLFAKVEQLAVGGDQKVRTFVQVGVCESILFRGDHPDWIERAQRYMGPQTLLDYIELEHQFRSM